MALLAVALLAVALLAMALLAMALLAMALLAVALLAMALLAMALLAMALRTMSRCASRAARPSCTCSTGRGGKQRLSPLAKREPASTTRGRLLRSIAFRGTVYI